MMNRPYWRVRSAAYSARIRPPHPHSSLPIPQKAIFHGSLRPLRARSSARAPPVAVIYSIHDTVSSGVDRSEEHTSELQSLMRISYAVFCLKKKKTHINHENLNLHHSTNNAIQ